MEKKLLILIFLLFGFATLLKAQNTGDYESAGSGVTVDLGSSSNWLIYNGSAWVAATTLPTGAPSGTNITIQDPDIWTNNTTVATTIPAGVTLTVNSAAAPGTFSTTKTITCGGNIVYSGTAAQTMPANTAFASSTLNNLTINNSAGVGIPTSFTVKGLIDLKAGILTVISGSINYAGSMQTEGGLLSLTPSNIVLYVTGATAGQVITGDAIVNSPTTGIYKLNSLTQGGVLNYSSTGPITTTSALYVNKGVFTLGGPLDIRGGTMAFATAVATSGAGSIVVGNNTVTFNASSAQTVPGGTAAGTNSFFSNNTIGNLNVKTISATAGGTTFQGPLTVNSSLTVASYFIPAATVPPVFLSGTGTNGVLNITGSSLTITAFSGTPVAGTAYTIASAPTITGTFTGLTLPAGYTGTLAYNTTATPNTVTLTVTPSSDATLSALALSTGTLTPVFASGTTSYTATVPNTTSTITITPTANISVGTPIKVNGATVASGATSAAIPLNVGSNTITTVVTAQDGTTTKTYTITVTRTVNANLASLALSSGTLSPAFAAATTAYTASVSNATSSITVTPTVSDPLATVAVNGTSVTSGSASAAIPLNVGSNTITTVVTAEDGTTTQTYTVNVTRVSSDAALSALTLSAGTLSPVFTPGTNTYTASVNNAATSVTITPTTDDATATVQVNGVTVASGAASGAIALNFGSNIITTVVTAQDGTTTQTYTTTVTRLQSSDAALSALALSAGTLSPVFAPGTNTYTASVNNTTASVTITPTTDDVNATVKVNGATVTSGAASGAIALSFGSNIITTVVTAQDGTTTQTYTTTVTRVPSSDADLSNLTISSGILTPAFSSATTTYATGVSTSVTSVTVTPTTDDNTATVKVNGTTVVSGNASGSILLSAGANTITAVVTAQDGTIKTYTLTVTRTSLSTNATLSGLSISSGTLSPVFASGTNSYTASVSNTTASVTVTPTVADATATVKVNGTTVTSGSASGAIPLTVGSNTITTVVTAQDGITQQTYTVTVTRTGSANAALSALALGAGTLSPVFASGTNSYTASVSNATTTITATPTVADANATIKINGTAVANGSASGAIPLTVGSNTITTVVTAQDGITTQTYTVIVTRAGSANAALSALALSTGTISPAFAAATTAYTASVSNATTSLTLTPTVADANATIKVNGTTVTSGSASGAIPLTVGSNIITTVVTAQDGITKQTYTITVTRGAASNANLATLTISSGTLSPVFASATSSYAASVSGTTTSITVTPTLSDLNASIKVNGSAVTSGNPSSAQALAVGANTITIVVTAQDGTTTQTYTVTVTRAVSPQTITFAPLTSITYGAADVSPGASSTSSLAITYSSSNTAVATITSSGAIHIIGAGSTIITASQSGNSSYSAATPVTQTLVVNQAVLTATVSNQSKVYCTVLPVFTITYTGFVNGDTQQSALTTLAIPSTTATTISAVGTYPITASGAVASANYTINYVAGTLTITPAPLTITANNVSKAYGAANPELTLTYSGFLNNDSFSSFTAQPVVATTATTTSAAGTYPITASGAVDANYTISYVAGTLTVTEANSGSELVHVRPGLSPNGDGINDYLIIDNIQSYPDNTLTIVNRDGSKIFQSSGYNNSTNVFDGHSSVTGALIPQGTYFYELLMKVNGSTTRKAGYIIVKLN
jgi:gliding motility-associated-like protein